jgi:hypothetical protein
VEGTGRGLYFIAVPAFSWRGYGKPMQVVVMVARMLDGIRPPGPVEYEARILTSTP